MQYGLKYSGTRFLFTELKLLNFPMHPKFEGSVSTVAVITKQTKEPNNRVLLRALLFGYIVSLHCNLCLGTYRSPEFGHKDNSHSNFQ